MKTGNQKARKQKIRERSEDSWWKEEFKVLEAIMLRHREICPLYKRPQTLKGKKG